MDSSVDYGIRGRLAACLGALLVIAALLAGCGSTATGSSAPAAYRGTPATVKLALDWTPNTNHTGIYVAQQRGWYRQQGIDLQLLPYSADVAPEQLVGTGKADFAISFTEAVTTSRAAGIPLVSVAAIIQHNTSALVSLKSSGLNTVASLAGKRYAGFGAPYEEPVIQKVLTCGHATSSHFQNVTTQLDPIDALRSKQFDFAWIFMGWEGVQAQRAGVALNVFPLTQYCVPDYYSPVIVSSQAYLAAHAAVARRFLAATAEGYAYAIAHPPDAANLLIAGAPAGTFDDTGLVMASQAYLSPRYGQGAKCWGQQTLAAWTNYPKLMFQTASLVDANGNALANPPDYGAAFTNQYLPACAS
ncbi:MAG TPA: ABC transporter substrate-binding protein [Ktedonobacterales bacterium]|jgi:ABC-type nitrate/sulfonate/bicarbonate transport system substrate-binding protein